MVNAILNGCNGAMGRVITDIVSKDDGIRIVAGVDVNPLKLADYEVYETLDQCPAADVVIDFSSAKATDGVVAYCEKTKTPVVLCTTGLSEEQLERDEGPWRDHGGTPVRQYVPGCEPFI